MTAVDVGVVEMPETSVVDGSSACLICGDNGSGFHYSVFSCEGCKVCQTDVANFALFSTFAPLVIMSSPQLSVECCMQAQESAGQQQQHFTVPFPGQPGTTGTSQYQK